MTKRYKENSILRAIRRFDFHSRIRRIMFYAKYAS